MGFPAERSPNIGLYNEISFMAIKPGTQWGPVLYGGFCSRTRVGHTSTANIIFPLSAY